MNCEDFNEQISEFADNELSRPRAEEMQAHLQICKPCTAELHSIQMLSRLVASSPIPKGHGPSWEAIAASLDSSTRAAALPEQPPTRSWSRPISILLCLAAILLIAIGFRFAMQPETSPIVQANLTSIDLQSVVRLFSTSPEAAVDSLAKRYVGDKTHLHDFDGEYQPIVSKSLPSGMQLVSTRVVNLPFCKCPEGQCICGPGDCDCVVCICERSDGSKLLIVENCRSYGVSFGDLETEMVRRDGHSYQLIRTDELIAASWSVNDRQLTAIGLTDDREADSLLVASFSAK